MTAPFLLADVPDADVVIVGELHDNAAHHAFQLQVLQEITPKAVVYEMLLPEEAETLNSAQAANIKQTMDGFHWSNIGDYTDLLTASPIIIGAALPREAVRDAFGNGAAAVFDGPADQYGLTTPLPQIQQAAREQLQFDAHCDMMPLSMMAGMVEAQRLRDAHFARVTLDALDTYGAPILVITGNGHARKDWGIPSFIDRVRPEIHVHSIGQSEDDGMPAGQFDTVQDAPSAIRGDPCAAFQ